MYSVLVAILIFAGIILAGLYLFGIRPYIVQTGSMSPTIPAGSISFVNHHVTYEEIQNQDIIAFRMGEGTIFMHRAVAKDQYGITTKGDANRMPDNALVTEDNFVGKAIFSIPELGLMIRNLRTKTGMMLFIIFIVLFILGGFLLDDDSSKKSKKKKPEQ